MEVLSDLLKLSQFLGTNIPNANPNQSKLLPLLCNPLSATLNWNSLKLVLELTFGSTDDIQLTAIQSNYAGIQSWISAFKRLEAVNTEEETSEVMEWLCALKIAVIQASLLGKDPTTDILHDVLATLNDPIAADEIPALTEQARKVAGASWALAVTQATGFNGESITLDPSIPLPMLPELTNDNLMGALDQLIANNSTPSATALGKRPRADSVERVASGSGIGKDDTNGGTMTSFVNFSDSVEKKENGASGEYEEAGAVASTSSGLRPIPTHTTKSPAGQLGTKALAANASKIEILAQRLSSVTGIPLARCIETVGRVPKEQLEAVDTTVRIAPPVAIPRPSARDSVNYSAPLPRSSQSPGPSSRNGPVPRAPPVPRAAPISRPSPAARASPVPRPSPIPRPATLPKVPKKIKEETDEVKKQVRSHDPNRPAFSYSALIGQAILSTPSKKMRLAEIYDFVTCHYPYYTKNECGWQNSIRHNLSLQPVFLKIPDNSAPGKKGCHWMILGEEEWRFEGGGWKKMDGKGERERGGGERRRRRKGREEGGGYSPGQVLKEKKRKMESEEEEEEEEEMEEEEDD